MYELDSVVLTLVCQFEILCIFLVKCLFAFGAFGEYAREELNNIFIKYKSKIELKQKEQCPPSLKKASTSSEIVPKVKVLSLA